ncbi:Alpha N-terminal protein methyltransferase 1 [Papilio machaon]|uniref:Alpha N-terminal protein methyltransferase 1 n=1 Tax=Papilio machaon TaxID=76193 RepID=A0A194QTT4_PAPMA|nr:Alpha N-terminal protein methyltransferase 1 [Papilio machaon]
MTEIKFYKKAASYWAKVPATVNGVLGGFGHISDIDIDGSRTFLNHLLSLDDPLDTKLALDCGAGVGRVSKYLLVPYFDKVDLVEQDEKFINTAAEVIGQNNVKLGTLYHKSLQKFKPDKKYDLIWCQWVLGYLTNNDLVDFLRKCSKSLAANGMIIIKENIAPAEELEYDDEDSSVTRPYKQMLTIFNEANLEIIKSEVQTGFPDDIYSVYMFALKPK